MKVKIHRLYDSAKLPQYASEDSGMMDLYACINRPEKIYPGALQKIPTGLMVDVPMGYNLLIVSRGGLYLKHKVLVANAPAVVDKTRSGEIFVILRNDGSEPFYVNPDAQIAQCYIQKSEEVEWIEN